MIPTTNTGVRRRKYKSLTPTMTRRSADTSVIRYSALGGSADTTANGNYANLRYYIGGNTSGTGSRPGHTIVGLYDTCRFLPGTHIEWVPNLGSNNPGRLWYCFTDNPERARNLFISWFNWNGESDPPTKQVLFDQYRNAVQSTANLASVPIWQPTKIQLPTGTRRKRFDVDKLADSGSTDPIEQLSRSMQQGFFWFVDGAGSGNNAGSMLFHDIVEVEGLGLVAT